MINSEVIKFLIGVPMPVGNLGGNSRKFYLGHFKLGIGWEFVQFVQSLGVHKNNVFGETDE